MRAAFLSLPLPLLLYQLRTKCIHCSTSPRHPACTLASHPSQQVLFCRCLLLSPLLASPMTFANLIRSHPSCIKLHAFFPALALERPTSNGNTCKPNVTRWLPIFQGTHAQRLHRCFVGKPDVKHWLMHWLLLQRARFRREAGAWQRALSHGVNCPFASAAGQAMCRHPAVRRDMVAALAASQPAG